MLKELQKLFGKKGLMEQALESCLFMLKSDWVMFREAVRSLRILVSIVIDIERIGDYTKNIVELAQNHPGRLSGGKWEDVLKHAESTISENFGRLIEALEKSESENAKQLLKELWKVKKSCDEKVFQLIRDDTLDFKTKDAVALALYMRYLKRVASHLMNIATSLVNPFHKIGYRPVE
ncbi:hypothetical protein B6D60_10985 [candidate division KSB1 bacterium 4484_87]|nr:MAG: hypothetical protein B6D60_10985 [candidate division KSB1 bacterium 4484_87]